MLRLDSGVGITIKTHYAVIAIKFLNIAILIQIWLVARPWAFSHHPAVSSDLNLFYQLCNKASHTKKQVLFWIQKSLHSSLVSSKCGSKLTVCSEGFVKHKTKSNQLWKCEVLDDHLGIITFILKWLSVLYTLAGMYS